MTKIPPRYLAQDKSGQPVPRTPQLDAAVAALASQYRTTDVFTYDRETGAMCGGDGKPRLYLNGAKDFATNKPPALKQVLPNTPHGTTITLLRAPPAPPAMSPREGDEAAAAAPHRPRHADPAAPAGMICQTSASIGELCALVARVANSENRQLAFDGGTLWFEPRAHKLHVHTPQGRLTLRWEHDQVQSVLLNGRPWMIRVGDRWDAALNAATHAADAAFKREQALTEQTAASGPRALLAMRELLRAGGHSYNSAVASAASSPMRAFDAFDNTHLRVWVREEGDAYYVNIQEALMYDATARDDKLGIKTNARGAIESIYVDGKPMSPEDFLGRAGDVWRRRLDVALDNALNTGTRYGNQTIWVHPLALERQPEVHLRQLLQSKVLTPTIAFLQDNGQPTPAVDMGGPKRQYFNDLVVAALDGGKQRMLKVVTTPEYTGPVCRAGITNYATTPQLAPTERETLNNLGQLYLQAYAGGMTVGRAVSDSFFAYVAAAGAHGAEIPLKPALVLNIASMAGFDNARDATTYDLLYGNVRFRDVPHTYLEGLFLLNPDIAGGAWATDDGMFDFARARAWAQNAKAEDIEEFRDVLRESLLDAYTPRVVAAQAVAQGMHRAHAATFERFYRPVTAQQREVLPQVSATIQGPAFDRQDIASRMEMVGDRNAIVEAKVSWLRAWVLDKDTPQEDVERLVLSMTGRSSLIGRLRFGTDNSGAWACQVHSCFNLMDVPAKFYDEHQRVLTPPLTPQTAAQAQAQFFNAIRLLLDSANTFDAR